MVAAGPSRWGAAKAVVLLLAVIWGQRAAATPRGLLVLPLPLPLPPLPFSLRRTAGCRRPPRWSGERGVPPTLLGRANTKV